MPAKTTQPSEDLHNPYGYSEMDWAAQLDPAYTAARDEVRRLSVGEDGALTIKVRNSWCWESWRRVVSSMGSRPTCAAPSRTGPPRRNYSRPSKPRPSPEAGW